MDFVSQLNFKGVNKISILWLSWNSKNLQKCSITLSLILATLCQDLQTLNPAFRQEMAENNPQLPQNSFYYHPSLQCHTSQIIHECLSLPPLLSGPIFPVGLQLTAQNLGNVPSQRGKQMQVLFHEVSFFQGSQSYPAFVQ